jgi:hypothetical protein
MNHSILLSSRDQKMERTQLKQRRLTNNTISIVLGLGFLAMGLAGCNSKSSAPEAAPVAVVATTTPPPRVAEGGGYNSADWEGSGQTVTFVPESFSTFNSYVGTHPLNEPSNYKINIKLELVGGLLILGGKIKIGYTDVGNWYEGIMETGVGRNSKCSNCHDNNVYEAAYNYYYMDGTKRIFSGYFQDRLGAIILVLEPAQGSGDGDGGTYKGAVFYRNFAQSVEPQSAERKCWFIREGAYDCRSSALVYKSSYTSFDNYTKLGTFTGIDPAKILK